MAVGSLVLPGGIAATNLRISASASILDHATPQLVVNSGSAFVASRAATSWQLELASLQAGATYDPRARAVTLDSLIATVPSVALSADTLRIHAGPADVRASGAWADRIELQPSKCRRLRVDWACRRTEQPPRCGWTPRWTWTRHRMSGAATGAASCSQTCNPVPDCARCASIH